MPLLSKRKRFCVYDRYLVCRHTLDIYITSTRVIGSIAADGTSGPISRQVYASSDV
jgi:hypothetical protein